MQNILQGLRIVEGSAFIAAPMCGTTLGQLGADVIRFDQLGGGLDFKRWPVTENNNSIYWAEMNKGKRKDVYHKLFNLIAQDAPYLFLTHSQSLSAINKRVKGLSKPGPAGLFNRIENIYVVK